MGEFNKTDFSKVIAKAEADAGYKQRLLSNPKAALAELGAAAPAIGAGVQVKVIEDTASTVHLVLPAQAGDAELDMATLDAVVGGGNDSPTGGSSSGTLSGNDSPTGGSSSGTSSGVDSPRGGA